MLGERKSRKKPELIIAGVNLTAGHLVAARRRELGWTQEDLAYATDISRTQIGRIERDESEPSVNSIDNLEKALGIELYDLFMEQRRHNHKSIKDSGLSTATIGQFGMELAKTGISEEELREVLNEALRAARSKTK